MNGIVTPLEYTGTTILVHLHNHTVYSTLDGVASPLQYAEECKRRGYPAMAATEHGNMASVPEMYLEFRKHGVKMIAGCEAYFNEDHLAGVRARNSKSISPQKANASDDPQVWEDYLRFWRSRHVTLLAKNHVGFENLIKLTTEANRLGTWRTNRPGRLWFDLLCKYKEGLIVLSGCLNGPVAYELRRRRAIRVESKTKSRSDKQLFRIKEQGPLLPRKQRLANALKEFMRWKRAFGDDYVVELQMPLVADRDAALHPDSPYPGGLLDLEVFDDLVQFADLTRTTMALSNDCHVLAQEDLMLQKLMMAIEQDVEVDSPDLFYSNSREQYMKTRAELWATWKNNPYSRGKDDGLFERMCDNTLEIASRCEPLKIDTSPKGPMWPDTDQELRRRVLQELRRRGLDREPRRWLVDGRMVTYAEQAEIELERFISKGFASYFLITADLVGFGKRRGYPFGPRGSAGGSLACMLLGIHQLDSLKWGLSFDRFMSPSRGGYMLNVKMPAPVN